MEYSIIRSKRKTVALEITEKCEILVRAPLKMSENEIYAFVSKYKNWIDKKLIVAKNRAETEENIENREAELRQKAKDIIKPLVEKYSKFTGLHPTSVKITSAKKRFGSCSSKNCICFSWRLMAYPYDAIEYVVLHEIAHIKHHNHSKQFYMLLQKYMPDYKERQKLLKK